MIAPSIYLRDGCILPPGMTLPQTRLNAAWSRVETVGSHELGIAMLARGWHCAWLGRAFSCVRVGRTVEAASASALQSGLDALPERFNAAEVEFLRTSTYGGLSVAKIVLRSCHLHKGDALHSVREEKRR